MVIPQQVEGAVDQEPAQFAVKGMFSLFGLFQSGFDGNNNISQQIGLNVFAGIVGHGKGKNISGAVFSPVLTVQFPHFAVVKKENAYFGIL